tara:strand:- start:366 stop:530 length:165 start_codon:yes stop_codon:yes gene_type:complete
MSTDYPLMVPMTAEERTLVIKGLTAFGMEEECAFDDRLAYQVELLVGRLVEVTQ